jgi:hypothetical protein
MFSLVLLKLLENFRTSARPAISGNGKKFELRNVISVIIVEC